MASTTDPWTGISHNTGDVWNGSGWSSPDSGQALLPVAPPVVTPTLATPTTTTTPSGNSITSQLQGALGNLEAAINSGNQKQYDLALGELMGIFSGKPTLKAQEDVGVVNGQPTEAARQFNLTTGRDLLSTAAALTGPKDYGDFMAYTGGGQRLSQQLANGRPASSAPTGPMLPMDLNSLMQKLGMAPGQVPPPAPAGAGGGGTDSSPSSEDSSFPASPNEGDLAFAKSGLAYDPNTYQNFISSHGYTSSFTPATPGVAADTHQQLLDWWNRTKTSLDSAGAEYPDRPVQFTNSAGETAYYVPGTVGFVSPDVYAAKAPLGWMNQNPHRFATAMTVTDPNAPGDTPGTPASAPSWLGDYINKLRAVGPNVNTGAAENLPLLDQLGLANPQGMQQLLNPAGQIDPIKWDQLGPVGQSLILQAAGKVFGWDPTEMQRQINAQRPLGAAMPADSVRTTYAPLAA